MAQATASNGSIYVCGRFRPPGNFSGQSATNGLDPNANSSSNNSGSGIYIVKSGDTMFLVARKLGMSLQALESLNPQIQPPAFQINVGDILQTNAGGAGGIEKSYTVVPGDSMFSIAMSHGVSLQALKDANPQVKSPQFQINVGQPITIP
jgi:LysM repeat protein